MKVNKKRLIGILLAVVLILAIGYFQEDWRPLEFLQNMISVQNAIEDSNELGDPAPSDTTTENPQNIDIVYHFASKQLYDSHYEKHGSEFGNITKKQYLQQVNALLQSSGEDILTKTRSNGDVIYYREATNEFAVKSAKDMIKTYFKPSDGIAYYHRQH